MKFKNYKDFVNESKISGKLLFAHVEAEEILEEIGFNKLKGGDIIKNHKELVTILTKLKTYFDDVSSDSMPASVGWSGTARAYRSGKSLKVLTNGMKSGGRYGFNRQYMIMLQIGGALPDDTKQILKIICKSILDKYNMKSDLGSSTVESSDGTNWSSVFLVAPSGNGYYTPLPKSIADKFDKI